MVLAEWLLEDIVIRRSFYNAYYVGIFIIMVLAVFIAFRYRFKRLSLFLWLTSGLIGFLWELILFAIGSRHYNPDFIPGMELAYHALTEAGPGLIIMIIAAHQWGIVDLSHLKDGGGKKVGGGGEGDKGGKGDKSVRQPAEGDRQPSEDDWGDAGEDMTEEIQGPGDMSDEDVLEGDEPWGEGETEGGDRP